jgi:hypothetical protein
MALVMQGLRRQLEVHLVDSRSRLAVLFLDLDGEVGAAQLAHRAADAELGVLGEGLALPEDEDMPGTKIHAYIAALAIPLAYHMDIGLLGLVAHRVVKKVYSSSCGFVKTNI